MSSSSPSSRSRPDRVVGGLLGAFAVLSAVIVLAIFGLVLAEAAPLIARVGPAAFFTDAGWQPTSGRFNLSPMLWGTLLTAAGALLLAGPVGVLTAVHGRFYAPPAWARVQRRVVELLAGIPSVVYGFWGLTVLVPLIARLAPPGPSLLAGILVLALMILPTVTLLADAALAAVPAEQLQGAAALGLGRWATVRGVALPAARAGIGTGVLLALGRAVGETMAVLMVCGNVVQVPESLADPVRTLAANVALEMAYAMGDHRAALFVAGALLTALAALLVALAAVVGRRHAHG